MTRAAGDLLLAKFIDGRTDLVFELLASGRASNSADARGTPLIAWCAHHGDVSAIRFLIEHGASLDGLGLNYGLHGAAFHGHWQLCQFLLECGADANHVTLENGESPLHAALCKANRPTYEHVVEVLLAAGADPAVTTRPGAPTDALMRDARTKGETPLHRAAAFGSPAIIERLLRSGASREAKDAHGDTPLSWASWHLRPPEVLRLLCYGEFSIHPQNRSTYDHGQGWSTMDPHARGHPRC